MTFSNLISGTVPHNWHAGGYKRRNRGGTKITRVIPHHWAGTAGGDARLKNPRQAVSANYIIYSDGTIMGQVPEEYGAWTTGGAAADNPSITFEIQNTTGRVKGDGDDMNPEAWKISDAAWGAAVRLTADIARRYDFASSFGGSNVRYHREFQATACPGGYIWARRDKFLSDVRAELGQKPAPTPKPKPETGSDLPAAGVAMLKGARLGDHLSVTNFWTYSDAKLSKKVGTVTGTFEIVGIDYNARPGDEPSLRIKDSGNTRRWIHVSAVDGKSNKKLTRFGGAGSPARKPAPARKTDAELAAEVWAGKHGSGAARIRSLGTRYPAVQALVNKGVGRGGSSAPAKPAKKSNAQIAREIVHGPNPWGNDPQRSQRLRNAGYDPRAVQREVNKLI